MCSINGIVTLAGGTRLTRDQASRWALALELGTERGRDAAGAVAIPAVGDPVKWTWHPDEGVPVGILSFVEQVEVVAILGNNRAEPTTEFLQDVRPTDLQPVIGSEWVTTHNGTIANDLELRQELGMAEQDSRIDSAVIAAALDRLGAEAAMNRLVGSLGLAAYHRPTRRLLLARNYKPLHVAFHDGALLFASRAGHLTPESPEGGWAFLVHVCRQRVEPLPPYRWVVLAQSGEVVESGSLPPDPGRGGALVIASGGLDSTVVTTALVRSGEHGPVTMLHFFYGCRAEPKEAEAVRQIAARLGAKTMFVEAPWLRRIGGSSLTDPSREVTRNEVGAEYAHEWVPARNMNFVAAACAIADAKGFGTVAIGTNLEEAGAYPDNTMEFVEAMDRAAAVGTTSRPRVIAPVGNLMKHEIVALGLRLNAPLDVSWSCYHGGELPCGTCGPCFMRRAAFRRRGVEDPVLYAEPFSRDRPIE